MRIIGALLLIAVVAALLHVREPAADRLHPDDPRLTTGDDGVVMLAADWCGYCRRQQQEFERAQVRYRILDVDTEAGDRAMRAVRARGVPVTIIGQEIVRGYDTTTLHDRLAPLGYRVFGQR